MNLERKAAIIGAIYGLLSLFFAMGKQTSNTGLFLKLSIIDMMLESPTYLGSILARLWFFVPGLGYGLGLLSFFIYPILLGAILGYVIAKIYLRMNKAANFIRGR